MTHKLWLSFNCLRLMVAVAEGGNHVADDNKKQGEQRQPAREPVRKIEEGSRVGNDRNATRTTDWVKPERPTKK